MYVSLIHIKYVTKMLLNVYVKRVKRKKMRMQTRSNQETTERQNETVKKRDRESEREIKKIKMN